MSGQPMSLPGSTSAGSPPRQVAAALLSGQPARRGHAVNDFYLRVTNVAGNYPAHVYIARTARFSSRPSVGEPRRPARLPARRAGAARAGRLRRRPRLGAGVSLEWLAEVGRMAVASRCGWQRRRTARCKHPNAEQRLRLFTAGGAVAVLRFTRYWLSKVATTQLSSCTTGARSPNSSSLA